LFTFPPIQYFSKTVDSKNHVALNRPNGEFFLHNIYFHATKGLDFKCRITNAFHVPIVGIIANLEEAQPTHKKKL
jgi:hypothetical protein